MRIGLPRHLRRNATGAEKSLWRLLRNRAMGGAKFRRQFPLGEYSVDFVCLEHRLIVEADGGQHNFPETDKNRAAWLESEGFRVMRFWNNDILENPDGIAAILRDALERASVSFTRPPARPPSPIKGEGK